MRPAPIFAALVLLGAIAGAAHARPGAGAPGAKLAEASAPASETSASTEVADEDLAGIPTLSDDMARTESEVGSGGSWSAQMAGALRSWVNMNISGDPREHDELVSHVDLSITARAPSTLTARLGARVRDRVDVSQDEQTNRVEVELREAFVGLVAGSASATIGQQFIRWGVADTFSPNDVINPVDLRDGPSLDFETPHIPVPAVRGLYTAGPITLEGVYVPIHVPHHSPGLRDRWGFLDGQPALIDAVDFIEAEVDPDAGDDFDEAFSSRPPLQLDSGSGGGRLSARLPGVDLGFNVFYGWDRTPAIQLDPSLRVLVARLSDPGADPADPATRMAVDAVRARTAMGLPIVDVTAERFLHTGVDFTATNGKLILKWEAAYSPEQTVYSTTFDALRPPALSWVIGVDYQPSDTYQVSVESGGRFLLEQPPEGLSYQTIGSDEAIVAGFARVSPPDTDVQLQLSGRFNMFHRDWAASPSVQLQLGGAHFLSFALVFLQGPPDSFGGVFTTNDLVYLRYQWLFL